MPSREDKIKEIKDLIIARREYWYASTEYKEQEKWYNALHKQYYRIFDNTQSGQPKTRNKIFFSPVFTVVEVERAFISDTFFNNGNDILNVKANPGTPLEVAEFNKQLLIYYTNEQNSNYKSTLEAVIRDTTLYGTGFDKNSWLYAEEYGRVAKQNNYFDFAMPPEYENGVSKIIDRPDVEHLEPLDRWSEPCVNPHNKRYGGYTFKQTIQDIKRWEGNDMYIQSEVKALLEKMQNKKASSGDDKTGLNRDFTYLQDGGADVLCHAYYGDLPVGENQFDTEKYCCWMCDDFLVRVQKNPWPHQLDWITRYVMQEDNKVGYGIPPAIAILPHALWKNAMINMKLDDLLMAMGHQFIVNTDRIRPDQFFAPRFPGIVEAKGDPTRAIQQLQVQDLSHGQFVDMVRMVEEDIQRAGVPDQSSGIGSTRYNETATGASIVEDNANRKLRMEAAKFGECAAESMNKFLKNVQENMPLELKIKAGGQDLTINKAEMMGDVSVSVENNQLTNRQLRLQRHYTALELLAQAVQLYGPERVQEGAAKIFTNAFKELEVPDAENIISRPQVQMAGAPTGGVPGQGMPPELEQMRSPMMAPNTGKGVMPNAG